MLGFEEDVSINLGRTDDYMFLNLPALVLIDCP